jgi:hypothetical protein
MRTDAKSWDDITSYKVEDHDSGYDVMKEYGGIPASCTIDRCSGDPLVHAASFIKEGSAIMISRFGFDIGRDVPLAEILDPVERYKALAATLVVDNVLHCSHDDVVVYGDLKGNLPEWDSYVMLWMDRSGKCSCARIQKKYWPNLTLDQFKAFHIESLRRSYAEGWIHNDEFPEAIITEIPGEFASIVYP